MDQDMVLTGNTTGAGAQHQIADGVRVRVLVGLHMDLERVLDMVLGPVLVQAPDMGMELEGVVLMVVDTVPEVVLEELMVVDMGLGLGVIMVLVMVNMVMEVDMGSWVDLDIHHPTDELLKLSSKLSLFNMVCI